MLRNTSRNSHMSPRRIVMPLTENGWRLAWNAVAEGEHGFADNVEFMLKVLCGRDVHEDSFQPSACAHHEVWLFA